MDLSLDDIQKQLQDSVARFVQEDYTFEQREKIVASGANFDPAKWKVFADLGWLGLPFAESDGGFGGGPVETMVICEQFGRGIILEPYIPTVVMGGGFLKRAPDALRGELIPKLVAGELQLASAYAEAQARYNVLDLKTTAKESGGTWTVNGSKAVVHNAEDADYFIVSARTSGDQRDREGVTLFVVPASASGISVNGYRTNDSTTAGEVEFSGVEVSSDNIIGEVGKGAEILEDVIAETILALGADAVGCMEILYKDTIEYSRTREQFGVPIGTFQVLQHRMVDMFMEHEQSKSLLYMAAVRLQEGRRDVIQKAASALKAQVGRSGRNSGQSAIQIHGGMGMTDELRVGHYFKRITMINATLGDTEYHLKRFAEYQ